MGLRIAHSLPEQTWRAFVEQHPQGNVFHTPEMAQVFGRAKGHEPELWAALEADQILALFMPVHICLRNGWARNLTTRTIIYGGVLSQPCTEGDSALRLLLQAYQKTSGARSLFTEVRNIFPLGHLSSIMLEAGFAFEDHLNYLIDLSRPADAIFAGIGKRTRKNITNGLNKARVTIHQVATKPDLEICYRLLSQTFRGAHVPLADYSLFEATFDVLVPERMAHFALASVDENAAATSVELLYKDVIYGWYGGMDRAYARYVPNELLMWHLLKWGAECGFNTYDFGGAGKPNEEYGVRDFKAKFGGELVGYGRNTWVPNPILMSVSNFAYQAIRHAVF